MANQARIVITAKDHASPVFAEVSRNLRTMDDNTLRLRQSLVGLAAAYGGLSVMRGVITTQAQFQQSIADLAAITGAGGDELKYLTDQAREMGKTTVYTASQSADAFKLVASLKPELLKNAEALSRVTHESLILAEASGSTLPSAANTLGQALNQFNADAAQSTRYINVLAAGQKYGSSMIDMTSQALVKFGVVAHNIGHLSFEDTVAAIEAVAKGGEYASEAGTHLRGVLLNLETQSNRQFKPSVVGLVEAFKNLSAAELSSAEEKRLFGKRNISAGEILMHNTQILQWLIDKVTASNVAYEQAHIRTNDLIGDTKALTSAYQDQQIAIGTYLNPAERVLIESLTMVIRGQSDAKKATDATRESSLQLAIVLGNYEDQIGNIAHGLAYPFEVMGYTAEAAMKQVKDLMSFKFGKVFSDGQQALDDIKNKWMAITDPTIVHRFEDNARRLADSIRKADMAKALGPVDLTIPSLLPTISDLAKYEMAQQRAASVTHKLSQAALAEANVMKQLRGQFHEQQLARLRSETVMSASQRALGDQFQKIETRKAEAMQKVLDLRSRETITDGEYKKMLDAINNEVVKQRQEAEKTQAAIDAMNSSWSHGAKQAMQEYIDTARNTAALTKKLFSDAFSGMEDALVTFVKTGKLDFKSLADSIITDMIRIEVKQQVIMPLMNAMGMSGGSGPTGTLIGGLASGLAGAFGFGGAGAGPTTYLANGGVMTAAGPMPLNRYAMGGVANTAQMAIFGEGSRPEAFVPLPDGKRIPVAMQGGNAGQAIYMTVNNHIDARGAGADAGPIIEEAAKRGTQRALAQVHSDFRRGGPLRSALGFK